MSDPMSPTPSAEQVEAAMQGRLPVEIGYDILRASLAEARRERDALDIELAMRNSDFYDAQAELRELRKTLARQNRDTSEAIEAMDAELRELRETALDGGERKLAAEAVKQAMGEIRNDETRSVYAGIVAKLSNIAAGTPEKADV